MEVLSRLERLCSAVGIFLALATVPWFIRNNLFGANTDIPPFSVNKVFLSAAKPLLHGHTTRYGDLYRPTED